MQRIVIDVVSDMVCPWCYLGKARLDLALAEILDEVSVDVNWRPYRLNPEYPAEGVDQKAELEKKLGGKEKVEQAHEMLTQLGKEVGINFDFDAIKIGPNTLDAHRLSLWAHAEGREFQDKVVNELFRANFEKGLNIGDHTVLADIGEKAGMNREVVEKLLASDADKDTVVAEIDAAQQMGVSGVPFFILDQKYAVSGAQSKEVLINALRDIARMKLEEHRAMN
ncbi:DsbA family oxidoreductase [Agrobacterium rubi]|uniref:DsbA family oxidoreductase n=1 Tax=Agrobacterium rubi TaxID=28099 RepID=UPI001572EBE5|nr:DsbA family oxidoreductase [Agrobacterium rubi]NTF07744.1 DsbA family oxidoreductase [Agrobacterium rubi]NTF19988.1 DsbA family oxidoreductase [Agrobacterium rubi]NTF26959.1 DsbA family oxidoreductase [Agrobacterium rubi]